MAQPPKVGASARLPRPALGHCPWEGTRPPSRVQAYPSQWAGTKGKQGPAVGGRSRVPHICVEKIMGDKSMRQASREVGVPLHMGSLESTVSTGEGNGAVITGQLG